MTSYVRDEMDEEKRQLQMRVQELQDSLAYERGEVAYWQEENHKLHKMYMRSAAALEAVVEAAKLLMNRLAPNPALKELEWLQQALAAVENKS